MHEELHVFKADRNSDDFPIKIENQINQDGSYQMLVTVNKLIIDKLKNNDKNGKLSLSDSVFKTMLANIISNYLDCQKSFVDVSYEISSIIKIITDVCNEKMKLTIGSIYKHEHQNKN